MRVCAFIGMYAYMHACTGGVWHDCSFYTLTAEAHKTYTYSYTHKHTCIQIHVQTYAQTRIHTSIHTYPSMYIHAHRCSDLRHMHTCTCRYLHTNTCTYIHPGADLQRIIRGRIYLYACTNIHTNKCTYMHPGAQLCCSSIRAHVNIYIYTYIHTPRG